MKRIESVFTSGNIDAQNRADASYAQTTTPPEQSCGVFVHPAQSLDADIATAVTLSRDPSPGSYPANIAEDAKQIWDRLLSGKRYQTLTHAKKSAQKWIIISKLFLDTCHQKGVTPFRQGKRKPLSLDSMSEEYKRYRSQAASLVQQMTKMVEDENLADEVARGAWEFDKTLYLDKRFVIVLRTKWHALGTNPKSLLSFLQKQMHFESREGKSGLVHGIGQNCSVIVRASKFPEILISIHFKLSKDKLVGFGIAPGTKEQMREQFDACARYWFRTKAFASLDTVLAHHAKKLTHTGSAPGKRRIST